MLPSFINRDLIPHKSGVYIYKDEKGKIIYVGKAIDLRNRVASYFSGPSDSLKTSLLVSEIRDIETIIVESELEALILEANLIKKHLPKFNISLKDDKDYLYIKVVKEDFPEIVTCRKQDLKDALKYFGPFPSSRTVKETLKSLRRVFPWCSNPPKNGLGFLDNEVVAKTRYRACFYRHLNLCPGACTGEISQEDYKKIINSFIKFMDGKQKLLLDELIKEMEIASENQKFEEASRVKKMIQGIQYLTQPQRVKVYLENPNFLQDEKQKGLEELQRVLNLPTLPERIEGYDISNVQGVDAVSSMVVLTHGEIDKSQYRKFKIHITGKPNDFAMHMETMRRRMKHREWQYPDMLLIDGGKGQVSSVVKQISETGPEDFKKIPIFGIAKRMEWLYDKDGNEIRLSKSSIGLKMLQKLRDESHRFAITYHRKLHRKSILQLSLNRT